MIFEALLRGSVAPATLVGAILFFAGFLPGLLSSPLRRLSFPVGFSLGFYFLNSIPAWPPTGSTSALFYVSLLCFLWTYLEAIGSRYYLYLRWLLSAVVVFMVLKPLLMSDRLPGDIPYVSGPVELALHILMLVFFLQFLWWLYTRGQVGMSRAPLAYVPLLSMTGLSLVMLFSGSGLLSQLAGTYCAVHAAALLLSLLSPRFNNPFDHQAFSVVMVFSFSLVSYYFLEAPFLAVALCVSPFLLLRYWNFLPLKPQFQLGQLIYLTVLSALPLFWAVFPLYKAYQSTGY